ncbi:hypothetical protein A1A1_07549 [Planococcus antarcticus DSM 14505]|uniref:Uncharacterized protein n=1 Tax=Planococcus antarcticus DSM 14505 TaxID=1185653 RepID=A0A1C7DHZ3_9BACL|nr:hypothetical protein BBH88_12415 [Planococcus antarcticus DSM 14505]EIM07018.1 hypothetical protein A1A1_07549 [Planococcus antarcticus DSM 14505]
MDSHSQKASHKEADAPKPNRMKTLMNLYGVFLFLGLLVSIHAHEISDIEGFLLFILIISLLYFLLLNLYFKSVLGRKVVFITLCLIAVISLFMVFYTAV